MWNIQRHLYLGDHLDAADEQLLTGMGITHVLNCAREVACHFPTTFEYLHLDLYDPDSRFESYIRDFCEFIDEAIEHDGAVLVHCRAGLSRSPSAIVAWLRHCGYSIRNALEILRDRVGETEDGFIPPDDIFLEQIRDYFDDDDDDD